jgi:two-component system, NtrC family, response regulator HydG
MPIYDMVSENTFRQDLLYRINTVEIHIPPLRERPEDISLLADHFIDMYCRKYRKNPKSIPSSTMKRLEKYKWPGNIRELQHAIERAIIMSEKSALQPEDFFFSHKRMTDRMNRLMKRWILMKLRKIQLKKPLIKTAGIFPRQQRS